MEWERYEIKRLKGEESGDEGSSRIFLIRLLIKPRFLFPV